MNLSFEQYGRQVIDRYALLHKSATEFGNKPCPNCGGVDRFWISNYNGYLTHHCRKNCDFTDRNRAMIADGAIPNDNVPDKVPYHVQKQIPLLGAARIVECNVLIPISDLKTGKSCGHQTIYPNSQKIFSKGMKKTNAGCFIGEKSNILYVCEGWATAVVVHMATGEQALFALDAKTLVKTAKSLDHPRIIIAADNDPEGISAARGTGLPYSLPSTEGWDWWDVFNAYGRESVREQLEKVCNQVQSSSTEVLDGFEFITGCELADRKYEPVEFLYDEIIPTPNLVLLAGAPKLGKSWFALFLAHQVARLGHKVVYLANEDNNRRLQARYREVADVPSENVIFFAALSGDNPIPKGERAHTFLRAIKEKLDPKVIIIDTVAAIRSTSEKENYSTVEKEFSTLRYIAHDIDIVIICVHHTKKKTDYEQEPLDSILGSQAIAATVETILVMQSISGEKNVKLFVTGKDVEQQELVLTWAYPGYDHPSSAASAGLGHAQQDVLRFIKAHPRCLQAAIVTHLGKQKAQISEICGKLVARGLIRKVENGALICTE